jgi:hypothetical protein
MNSKKIIRKLSDIVNQIDDEILQEKYDDTKNIIEIVAKFIKTKKLMIYGGYALNQLLPKKYKFYKTYTINDYDCFSKNAKDDALELAKMLKNNGYKYIKVRRALHDNTYKVLVNFVQILDITQISPELYDNFLQIHYDDKTTSVYKYYKETYCIVPFILLMANLHFELARPTASHHRWEKIYLRSLFLPKLIKSTKVRKSCDYNVPDKIIRYVKKKKLLIVSSHALKYYDLCGIQDDTFMILTTDLENTKDDLIKLGNASVEYDDRYPTIIGENYTIKFLDNFKVKVIDVQHNCYSTIKRDGLMIGSIDTIMYFACCMWLINHISGNKQIGILQQIYNLEHDIYNKYSMVPDIRLSKQCYGVIYSLQDILKDKWKKKQTIQYF